MVMNIQKSVHQIPKYIQKMYKLYKTCTQFRLKTAGNLKCMFFGPASARSYEIGVVGNNWFLAWFVTQFS